MPPDAPEQAGAAEEPPPPDEAGDWPPVETGAPHEPAADDWPPPQARERPAPAAEEPAPASDVPTPAPTPEAGDPRLVPALDGGPGAPPDAGTLARIIPGVLIAMAIGIALLVAGIVGIDSTPATTDDIDPPSLREPVRELDTTGTLRTPPAPESDAATDAN